MVRARNAEQTGMPVRTFSTIRSQFWSGTTGKAITIAGKDTRIVATYLLTCEHANMLGFYRLPLLYIAEESGLKRKEVLAAFENLKAIGFAYYDEGAEFVWVVEMARFQLGLLPGEQLKGGDKRTKGAASLYRQLPVNPFLGPFHDRYVSVLNLPLRRDFISETKPLASPFKGASEPLTRGYDHGPHHVHDRKGDTGETKISPGTSTELTPELIQERWNTIPGVKPCKALGTTIRERVQTRLREQPDPSWWNTFLQRIQASDFLCGRTNGKEGPFHASLDWILGPKNLDKILAGNYDSIASNGHARALTCTKRIQLTGDRFLRDCGQPASSLSSPNEPRCSDHLTVVHQLQEVAVC